ncbi:hypothetical protein NPIL_569911 [Nephila pilipes]|uniref:Uncharacterized protein n=1 Tax=Nephila pilipes TaxID=299642 RepID=A0A8X6Q6P4_NEPPI|nr:hypothetical protein NPIL_569911 [Nephila pilipes]
MSSSLFCFIALPTSLVNDFSPKTIANLSENQTRQTKTQAKRGHLICETTHQPTCEGIIPQLRRLRSRMRRYEEGLITFLVAGCGDPLSQLCRTEFQSGKGNFFFCYRLFELFIHTSLATFSL